MFNPLERPSFISDRPSIRYGGTIVVLGICTTFALGLNALQLAETNLVMMYVLGVTITSAWFGAGPGILASFCGVLLFNFFFTSPHYTLVEMKKAMYNLEDFIRAEEDELRLPPLIQCGIAHAQFETIHPFLDGNGRVGRLLIVFMLCQKKIIREPILYISHYMNAHKLEYYERLQNTREDGDWEGWLKFFLKGVYQVSHAATNTTDKIHQLRERDKTLAGQQIQSQYISTLHDYLFLNPVLTINMARDHLECSYPTAQNLITSLVDIGILKEIGDRKRNKLFRYGEYLDLFDRLSIE